MVLFLVFGQWLGPYGANALALALCTAANTWAHARLAAPPDGPALGSGRARGRDHAVRRHPWSDHRRARLATLVDPSSKLLEVVAIAVATAAAALLRFVVVHAWSFRLHRRKLGTRVTTAEETTA